MPPNPSPTANLPCEQCGYLNEPERVYCHNCGAKLDRSLLPKTEEKKQEQPDKARKRIAKMTNPQSGWFGREVKTLFKVAFWSAAIAAVFQICREPEGVPPEKKESTLRLVSGDMMDAVQSPTPRPISFTEDEINEHLKRKLKATDLAVPGVQFTRAYVNLRPGGLRLCSRYSVWGFPVYVGVEYFVEVKDGKFAATIIGGNFGRLQVDPQLMKYVESSIGGPGPALGPERKQMDQMLSVKVEDKRIDLVTKGTAGALR